MVTKLIQLVARFIHSLSFKLSFFSGLILFLAILVFASHSITAQEQNLIDKMIQGALKDSEVIKAAIWNGMLTKDREVIRQIVSAIGATGGFETVNIYDASGSVRYSSSAEKLGQRVSATTDPLLAALSTDASARHRISEDGQWLFVVNPLVNTQSCSSVACHAHPESDKVLGALRIKVPLAGVRSEIQTNARKTTLFAAFLFVLISTIIGLAVIFLVTPNLRALQENAAKMARGEYEPRAPSEGSDELADLARSFDDMSRQINERTRQLAASRQRYKTLFEDVPCYLTVVDRNYRIVRANKAFLGNFGNRVGIHCYVGYKGRDSRCEACPVERTFADGCSHQSEEIWNLDGEDANVIVKTAPIHDDNGNIVEVLEMSLDVTVLKNLQTALRNRQREYKYLFEHVPCYLTVVDRDFNIVQANAPFQQDFGSYEGRKCFNVYKSQDEKCPDCPVEKTFLDGLSHQSEEVWLRDGEETYVIVNTASVLDEAGTVKAVMEMSTNITEVKRLQGELALLGETIAGMSHSIKNILGGLQGGVYIVDSGLKSSREDKIRTGWDMVGRNVEKVSELVRGILYASKERQPEYRECNPGEILTEVCDLYQGRAESEGVELIRDFPQDLGRGNLDPTGIHSALSNLISNALDACRWEVEGKRFVKVSARLTDGSLVMKVIDSGKGMPEEVKKKLFSKFFSTKGSDGTGLGLVVTRKLIKEHGGTIQVDSRPGRTAFTIRVPFGTDAKDTFKQAV